MTLSSKLIANKCLAWVHHHLSQSLDTLFTTGTLFCFTVRTMARSGDSRLDPERGDCLQWQKQSVLRSPHAPALRARLGGWPEWGEEEKDCLDWRLRLWELHDVILLNASRRRRLLIYSLSDYYGNPPTGKLVPLRNHAIDYRVPSLETLPLFTLTPVPL